MIIMRGGAGTGSSPEIDAHGMEPRGFEAAFVLQVSSLMHVVKVDNRPSWNFSHFKSDPMQRSDQAD